MYSRFFASCSRGCFFQRASDDERPRQTNNNAIANLFFAMLLSLNEEKRNLRFLCLLLCRFSSLSSFFVLCFSIYCKQVFSSSRIFLFFGAAEDKFIFSSSKWNFTEGTPKATNYRISARRTFRAAEERKQERLGREMRLLVMKPETRRARET